MFTFKLDYLQTRQGLDHAAIGLLADALKIIEQSAPLHTHSPELVSEWDSHVRFFYNQVTNWQRAYRANEERRQSHADAINAEPRCGTKESPTVDGGQEGKGKDNEEGQGKGKAENQKEEAAQDGEGS